jgi:hypothetical protein
MPRPSFRDYVGNWRTSDASLARKTGVAALNTLRRLRLKGCCGHPGEPGC